ncbi:tachylectin-related carbohydrate-binding protein [Actinoplanes sp. L3-i22]|uniref:S1 family peptidase n=1 Tax=Actinoplanes sp. L3-i22 TaxID=2836373 RepID=UPI001C782B5A|nr:S1 family peptidase [Actinoplanes sp. L3-i22]BCY13429.1 hypothetical protein L3i22_085170 [Actinoplanes sp. L3-i22]
MPAFAVGGAEATGTTYDFVAKVSVGSGAGARGCSGALVAPQWIVTAADCFASDGKVAAGVPAVATTATVGRADLTETDGLVAPVVYLVPNLDRGVVLAKLATPATGITPVVVGASAPSTGDELTVAGFGRTATEWVPKKLHTGTFGVTAADDTALTIAGSSESSVICKGDAGGPALRSTSSGLELVALNQRTWQGGCLGETETRREAVEIRVDNLAGWIKQTTVADVSIFGTLADGHLTYSAIVSSSGDRLTTVTSTATLGFTPKALATLNANTLLATDTAGVLYRVDVTGVNPALTFNAPVKVGTGWTHDLLAYDGDGSLFGIAANTLRRYTVTSAKPEASNIINNTVIGSGFALKTLTATGPDWILGTTDAGVLRSYYIDPVGKWTGYSLVTTGWAGPTHLVSPGNGIYYARNGSGRLDWYTDGAPFDGKGTDIASHSSDPVDASGWNQTLLSAAPLRAFPQNAADVSVFGVDDTNHLTYTATDAFGAPIAAVTSAATLPFEAKAIATLNYDTVLVTATTGRLFRIDVTTTLPVLTFAAPVDLAGGWTHDMLAYDGAGSLFGIASGTLRRYTITSTKPVAANITANTSIGTGFTLKAFTTTGRGWILGNTSDGRLVSYNIDDAGKWTGYTLATSGWDIYTRLASPGNGMYYGVTAEGTVGYFRDAAPYDGKGTDIEGTASTPEAPRKWSSKLVSAVPFIS